MRPQPADGAISGNPDFLFLDEPTAGLDVESRRSKF